MTFPDTCDIEYDTLTPICRLCGHIGPTLLVDAPDGRARAAAAGAQHVIDHHPWLERSVTSFDLVDLIVAVHLELDTGIQAVQHALDRANAAALLDRAT